MKFLLPIIGLLILAIPAYAQSMSNSSHTFDINNDPNEPTPTQQAQKVEEQPDEVSHSNRVISGDNFVAYLSYDDDTGYKPLVSSISSDSLNFGKIVPGEPLIRTQSIRVIPGTDHGYQVVVSENHGLKNGDSLIPDTSCDTGNCTQILSDVWDNPLTYGYGYRCDSVSGSGCTNGFEKDQYKRFPNDAAGESSVTMIEATNRSDSIVSYKLNVAGIQPDKAYQNIIYYITAGSL